MTKKISKSNVLLSLVVIIGLVVGWYLIKKVLIASILIFIGIIFLMIYKTYKTFIGKKKNAE